jgi:hypothetical protein
VSVRLRPGVLIDGAPGETSAAQLSIAMQPQRKQ